MRKGGIGEMPRKPAGSVYKNPIPIIWVESVDDAALIDISGSESVRLECAIHLFGTSGPSMQI